MKLKKDRLIVLLFLFQFQSTQVKLEHFRRGEILIERQLNIIYFEGAVTLHISLVYSDQQKASKEREIHPKN